MSRRLLVAFQPHRYTRTQHLLREFAEVLRTADELVLTDIYSAGEEPIPGVTVDELVVAIANAEAKVLLASDAAPAVLAAGPAATTAAFMNVSVVPAVGDLPAFLAKAARPGDMVITLGAGSISTVGPRLLQLLRERESAHTRDAEKGRVH
jgi:UDP-N-acetylmuramate--alanine ligase